MRLLPVKHGSHHYRIRILPFKCADAHTKKVAKERELALRPLSAVRVRQETSRSTKIEKAPSTCPCLPISCRRPPSSVPDLSSQ